MADTRGERLARVAVKHRRARDWLDDEELLHAAELFESDAESLDSDDPEYAEHKSACLDTARVLRRLAAAAKASTTIGRRGWPVLMVEAQGTGKHMRRKPKPRGE